MSDLFEWGSVEGIGMAVPIFTQDPFRNVAVALGDAELWTGGYHCEYVILRNPTDRDLDNDPDFHKYLGNVIQDILKEKGHNNDKTPDKTNTS